MKKIIEIRNYWFLLGIVHFAFMWGVNKITEEKLEQLEINWRNNYSIENDSLNDYFLIIEKQVPIIHTYFFFFFFSLLVMLVILGIVVYKYYKAEIKFFIIWFLVYTILIGRYLIGPMNLRISYSSEVELHQIVFYLTFVPYAYLIFKYSIFGIKVDISDELSQTLEIQVDEEIQKLKTLQNADILTTKEVETKTKIIVIEKMKKEVILSKEYDLLCQLEKSGTLTSQEVQLKIEELVNKRYEEQVQKSKNY